jgi:hypothetical protein
MSMTSSTLAVLLAAGLAACTTAAPRPLTAAIQTGPAFDARPRRVLVLDTECGTLATPCPPAYRAAVDSIVRGRLEFAGYALVQPDQLKLDTRGRTEQIVATEAQSSSQGTTTFEKTLSRDSKVTSESAEQSSSRRATTTLDGSIFEDLSVADRQEVIRQAGADAVATVRVVIGGLQMSWTSGNHNVEVMVKLGVNQGDTMAWASRCIATSEQFSTIEAALEAASRCAMTVLD